MLAACVLGPIIPPSIVFVIYGLATDTSVGRLFLAGIIPGVVIGILLMLHISIYMRIKKPDWGKSRAVCGRKGLEVLQAREPFALLSPFVIIGAILAGVATPSRSARSRPGYALLVGFAYGGLSVRGLIDCVKESVIVTAVIMYLIAVSSVMGWIVTTERIAHDAAHSSRPTSTVPFSGSCHQHPAAGRRHVPRNRSGAADPVADPASRGQRLGIDPVTFGVIISYNLILGIIHPPLGIGLFVARAFARITPEQVLSATWPFFIRCSGAADYFRGAGTQSLASEHRLCVARIEVSEGRMRCLIVGAGIVGICSASTCSVKATRSS
jgi:TRAP-type C4-dicarboxylate transport system permease large subunit